LYNFEEKNNSKELKYKDGTSYGENERVFADGYGNSLSGI
jgi:hypothetical protein